MAQYSSQTTAPTPDNIYFDVTATNFGDFGADPPTFQYNEKRAIPYLQCPEDYYLSVIRFTCETGTLPVFIPTINPPEKNQIYKSGTASLLNPQFSAGQETIYQVGMSVSTSNGGEIFATQNVMWSPQDLNANMPPYNNGQTYQDWVAGGSIQNAGNYDINTDKYYNCYSYNYFISLIQNAISMCYSQLGNNYNNYMTAYPWDTCLLGTPKTDATSSSQKDYASLFPVCPQITWNRDTNSATIVVDTAGWTSNITKSNGDLVTSTKLVNYTNVGMNLKGSTNFMMMPAAAVDVQNQRTSSIQSLAFVAPPTINSGPVTFGSSQYFVLQSPNTALVNVASATTSNQNGASITITIPIGIATSGSVTGYSLPYNSTSSMTLTHNVSSPLLFIYKNGVFWRKVTPNLLFGGATSISFPISWTPNNLAFYTSGMVMNISQGSYLGTYQYTIPIDYGNNSYSFSFQATLTTVYGNGVSELFSFAGVNLTSTLLYNASSNEVYVSNSVPNVNGQFDYRGLMVGPGPTSGSGYNRSVTILPTGFQPVNVTFAVASPAVPNPALNLVGSLQANLNPLSYGPFNFNLFFNPALYQILSGFSSIYHKPWSNIDNSSDGKGYLPPNSISGNKYYYPCAYKLNFHNYGHLNTQNYPSSYNTTNATYVGASFQQEYSSIHNISPIIGLVFCSNTLPVISSQVSTPLVYSNGSAMIQSGLNADTANIITDLTSNDGSYRPFLVYEPTAQYRYISLLGSQPLDNLDLSIYYRTRTGKLIPFTLASGSTVTLKLAFIKKSSVSQF
jgi:hypothetical protein